MVRLRSLSGHGSWSVGGRGEQERRAPSFALFRISTGRTGSKRPEKRWRLVIALKCVATLKRCAPIKAAAIDRVNKAVPACGGVLQSWHERETSTHITPLVNTCVCERYVQNQPYLYLVSEYGTHRPRPRITHKIANRRGQKEQYIGLRTYGVGQQDYFNTRTGCVCMLVADQEHACGGVGNSSTNTHTHISRTKTTRNHTCLTGNRAASLRARREHQSVRGNHERMGRLRARSKG